MINFECNAWRVILTVESNPDFRGMLGPFATESEAVRELTSRGFSMTDGKWFAIAPFGNNGDWSKLAFATKK